MASHAPRETFQRHERVRKLGEFARVYQTNAYAADSVLVVQICKNDLPNARLGLSVSRRVGNAVVRNRWKRLVREAFRRSKSELPQSIDIVIRPRKGSHPDYRSILRSLPRLVRSALRKLPSKPER